MARKILITVDESGGRRTEFFGFEGDSCFDEARKLDQTLRDEFGIETDVKDVKEKPSSTRRTEKIKVTN